MRTTVTLDDALVEKAVALAGVKERGALLREALTADRAGERAAAGALGRQRAGTGGARTAAASVILADTSVWVGHLREGDAELARRLEAAQVVCHPWVIAELALGTLKDRVTVLGLLDALPALPVASVYEVRR